MVEILLVTVVGLVLLAGIVLPAWAFIDIVRRPDDEWERVGQNKLFWILFVVVTLPACGAGWIVPTIYLVTIRPKFDEASGAGSAGGPPPTPPLPEVGPPA